MAVFVGIFAVLLVIALVGSYYYSNTNSGKVAEAEAEVVSAKTLREVFQLTEEAKEIRSDLEQG